MLLTAAPHLAQFLLSVLPMIDMDATRTCAKRIAQALPIRVAARATLLSLALQACTAVPPLNKHAPAGDPAASDTSTTLAQLIMPSALPVATTPAMSAAQPEHATPYAKWSASRPKTLGMLAGFEAMYQNPDVAVYGSDMAASFVHDGKIVMLFGDTFGQPDSACDQKPGDNDDMVGTLPLEPGDAAPKLEIVTRPDAPTEFARVRLLHQGQDVLLDEFKIPVTGWSDGSSAYALFQVQEPVACKPAAPAAESGCPTQAGVQCMDGVYTCATAPVTVPVLCEPQQPVCLLGGCKAASICVDTHSSQYDGSPRGRAASMLSKLYVGKAHGDDLATFDSIATLSTNVFSHPTARTVKHFTGETQAADYNPGHGDLLIWGRPGMYAEQGRESRVYFATASLPLATDNGQLSLRYFAGIEDESGQPRWSSDAGEAKALSLDGQPNGDAHEPLAIVGTTTVSWLGDPINQWVMLYGGDLADHLLADPAGSRRTNPVPGSVVMRFAQHPWGPWSAAVTHLSPGSPSAVGGGYGPGGFLFNPECADLPNARCARNDPYSLDLFGRCVMQQSTQPGRAYAPAIVDAYTRKNEHGGLDITWAVSSWQPYAAHLMRSAIDPASD